MKLKVEDLSRIAEEMKATRSLRDGAARARVVVHMGTCGIAAGARGILTRFLALKAEAAADDVMVTSSGCAGLCSREPMCTVERKDEAPVKYADLTEQKAARIFREHVIGGEVVSQYALAVGSERVG